MEKAYFCKSIPAFSIGTQVQFVNNWFRTDNKFVQNIVEKNDYFGRLIVEFVPPEPDETMKAEVDAVMSGAGEAEASDPDVFDCLTHSETLETEETQLEEEKLTATKVNQLPVADLKDLAVAIELDPSEFSTTALRREVKIKLEL